MQEVEFFKWLKGYVEITNGAQPSPEQWKVIVAKLNEPAKTGSGEGYCNPMQPIPAVRPPSNWEISRSGWPYPYTDRMHYDAYGTTGTKK